MADNTHQQGESTGAETKRRPRKQLNRKKTGTMTTISTDTTLGTDRTQTFIHCKQNNTAQKLISTTSKTLK